MLHHCMVYVVLRTEPGARQILYQLSYIPATSLHLFNSHFPMSLQNLGNNPLTLCQMEPFKIKSCLVHTYFLDIWVKYYLLLNLCSLKLQQMILLEVQSFQI